MYKFEEIEKMYNDLFIAPNEENMPKLNKVYTKFNPVKGKKCFKVKAELRYVDPFVRIENSGFNLRVSEIDKEIKHEIYEYLNSDTDLYMYSDYED